MTAPRTARARVRAELTAEIKAAALRQLAADGAAGLSLRAVARELGMVSSALYRYFPSRDDLLTALIIDSYEALGATAERADADLPAAEFTRRWLTVGHAIRGWAITHPHEYALLYGSPVPGYRAPQDTVPAATRVSAVLAGILRDATAAGAGPAVAEADLPPSLTSDVHRLQETIMAGVPAGLVLRALLSWTALFGTVSFELFGHLNNVVTDYAAGFDHQLRDLAVHLGLPPTAS